jgi:hypothetical protein
VITTNNYEGINAAIDYYLERLKDGPMDDKKIQNVINNRFKISGATVRNKLIEMGAIEIKKDVYNAKRQRNIYIVSLVDESKVVRPPIKEPEYKTIVIETHWPEGWKKSSNNAFDWRNTAQGLFTKAELASMQTKIKSNPGFTCDSVHTYSKAKASV